MIFINYRKKDSQPVADHLASRLRARFGEDAVFKDDLDLEGGDRWPDRLQEELQRREVVVALIGSLWLAPLDARGGRRIDDPEDRVRRELSTALERRKLVLALLVDRAPVIGVAFNPKGYSPFVMRHGEVNIQEYNLSRSLRPDSYPLDKPLVINADVRDSVVARFHPVGRDTVLDNFRRVTNVNFRAYQSGRLHVFEDGKSLCAVVPGGVYIFPIEKHKGGTE
jgi:hypothetical protein